MDTNTLTSLERAVGPTVARQARQLPQRPMKLLPMCQFHCGARESLLVAGEDCSADTGVLTLFQPPFLLRVSHYTSIDRRLYVISFQGVSTIKVLTRR